MANTHCGNLADVFKHLALAEVLHIQRPAEYWESHAGCAAYQETAPTLPERLHGVHTFKRLAADHAELQLSTYGRILASLSAGDAVSRIPGSPLIAHRLLTDRCRRMLLCDIDHESLHNIRTCLKQPGESRKHAEPEKTEYVQEDGVSVLRGAGMLLPEPWIASTLAFLDPYTLDESTAAEISPLELACELANRGIATVLFYTFADDANRALQHERFTRALEKSRLLQRGAQFIEGSLKTPPGPEIPTQWGFGLLLFHVKAEALTAVHERMRALESAYEKAELTTPQGPVTGAWRYSRAAI
jgi:23S rRNA A2030 N6-methylase RlmJ